MNETTNETGHSYVRWMIRRDLADVLALEHYMFSVFPESRSPWFERDYTSRMRETNVIGLACEINDSVCGNVLYRLEQGYIAIERLNYANETVAGLMIDRLIGKLAPHRRNRIIVDVDETEMDTLLTLRANGFLATELVRNGADRRDVIVMTYAIDQ